MIPLNAKDNLNWLLTNIDTVPINEKLASHTLPQYSKYTLLYIWQALQGGKINQILPARDYPLFPTQKWCSLCQIKKSFLTKFVWSTNGWKWASLFFTYLNWTLKESQCINIQKGTGLISGCHNLTYCLLSKKTLQVAPRFLTMKSWVPSTYALWKK